MPISEANLYRESYQDIKRADIVKCIVIRTVDLGSIWGADVQDEFGNIYKSVPVLTQCGGSNNAFSVMPIYTGQEVYVLKTSPNAPKYILGGIFKSAYEEVLSFVPFVPIEEEIDAICKNDWVVHNQDNQIALSASNGVIVKSNGNIRIQLGVDGRFKISKNGTAGEFALGATRFLLERKRYTDEMQAKIEKLELALAAQSVQIDFLTTQLTSFAAAGASAAAPAPLSPLAAPFGDLSASMTVQGATNNTSQKNKNNDFQNAPLRSSVDTTGDCKKAIIQSILIPKS